MAFIDDCILQTSLMDRYISDIYIELVKLEQEYQISHNDVQQIMDDIISGRINIFNPVTREIDVSYIREYALWTASQWVSRSVPVEQPDSISLLKEENKKLKQLLEQKEESSWNGNK